VSTDPTDPQPPRRIDAGPGHLEAGRVVAGRYAIRDRLGAGGMGAVYRAFDRELNEEVAFKVLRDGGAGSLDRFRREVRLARRIAHPNVCRVFDLGEDGDLRFLTMELVEGQTLRALLGEGALQPERALGLFAQLAEGVGAAHAEGIVHRDLKPENVIVRPDGRAVVVDFGLAIRAVTDTTTAVGAGTPRYMSPEQLLRGTVGPESDVFSLGLVGYELLTGRGPFGDGPPAAVTSAILRDAPAALDRGSMPGEVSTALVAVIDRALAKRAEDRFADAGALAKTLAAIPAISTAPRPDATPDTARPVPKAGRAGRRKVNGLVLLMLALGLLASIVVLALHGSSGPSVLVLAFDDLVREGGSEGLAKTAAEAVRAGLRTVPGLRVVEGGEATWQVRGSVQRVGGSVRIQVQFERDHHAASDPFEVEGALATPGPMVDALRDRSIDETRRLVREDDRRTRAGSETRSDTAKARLLAYYELIGPAPRPEHVGPGMKLLDEAVAADPRDVPALVARGHLLALRAATGGGRPDLALAGADADAAIAVAPGDRRPLALRCKLRRFTLTLDEEPEDGAVQAAFDACSAALSADPASASVRIDLAKLGQATCDDDQAIALLEQAIVLDRSRSGEILRQLAELSVLSGQLALADRSSERLLAFQEEEERLGPRALSQRAGVAPTRGAHMMRGSVLLRLGRTDEARAELQRDLEEVARGWGQEATEAASIRGLGRAQKGPLPPDLERRLKEIEAKHKAAALREPAAALQLAGAYLMTDPEAALAWLALAGSPASCGESIDRALIQHVAGDDGAARQSLSRCHAQTQWEQRCVGVLTGRIGSSVPAPAPP
jgi:tetratricopeptide (TPR) repeat protein